MNKIRKVISRFLVAFIAAVTLGLINAHAQASTFSFSEVYRADNSVVEGAGSHLRRGLNDLTLTIHTMDLEPGAYTVWWVIHNYPEFCSERPCTLADEENPLVQASLVNATGGVVGHKGVGNFGAWLGMGLPPNHEVLFGPGLLNPAGADILPVIRHHGPIIPGRVKEQTSTFEGGCDINQCSDPQYSYHPGQ